MNFVKKHGISLGIIILAWFIIVIQNYSPGTWLSGWDNLHPEFDLLLNIRRALTVTWQEYQGLGLLGGMAHAADLPRQIILLIFSVIVPANLLRYGWTFLMLLAGPMGAYILAKNVLLRGVTSKKDIFTKNISSLIVGLFYLFNLATVQYFFVPFETFVSFYGFLPWLLYFALKYFTSGKRRDALFLLFTSVIASPAFYVHTLFLVYLMVLGVILVGYWLKAKKINIKRSIKLGLLIIVASAFWLLPASMFAIKNPKVVENSKINVMSTHETQLMNEATGNISNISQLKGFWFEYLDTTSEGEFDYLMTGWREHTDGEIVRLAGYALFVFSLFGFLLAFKEKKYVWKYSGLGVFVLVYLMLASSNPPFEFVFDLFAKLPLMGQAFRSVFTKWSVVAALVYAWGLGLFAVLVAKSAKNLKKDVLIGILIILSVLMFVVTKPVFNGELIYFQMRTKIPQGYFDMFRYFNSESKEERILYLPAENFWGWNLHNWGYKGSGFLWYGIEQPILDRAFDVWSSQNETFYHELSTAVYGGNSEELEMVFDKYDVTYVILDESVIAAGQDRSILRIPETKQMLTELGAEIVFQKDFLTVYKLSVNNTIRTFKDPVLQGGFVYAPDTYIKLYNDTLYTRRDLAYSEIDYVDVLGSVTYPFSNIFKEKTSSVTYEGDSENTKVVLESRVQSEGAEVVIPPFNAGDTVSIPVEIRYFDKTVLAIFESNKMAIEDSEYELNGIPSLALGTNEVFESVLVSVGDETFRVGQNGSSNKTVTFTVGKDIDIKVYSVTSNDVDIADSFLSTVVEQCWTREGKQGLVISNATSNSRAIEVTDAAACLSLPLVTLEKDSILSVVLPFRSIKGEARPQFCIVKSGESECLNNDVYSETPTSDEWSEAKDDLVLPPGKYWMVVSVKPSDRGGVVREIEYKPPIIKTFSLVNSSRYDSEKIWENYVNSKRINVGKNTGSMKLKIATEQNKVNLGALNTIEPNNCDIFERGKVDRQAGVSGHSIIYSADDRGAVCDYFELSNTMTNQTYLMRLLGEGLVGRGTKFYLYNQSSGNNDLEMLLPSSEFDKTYAVIDWSNLEPDNYTLNLEVRSFGDLSENRIDAISYYSVPLNWISSIRIEPNMSGFGEITGKKDSTDVVSNNIKINSVGKTGTYKYVVEIEGDGLIVLSQGYEDGWIAYESGGVLPILFGKRFEHVKVNGWANGWNVIDRSSVASNKSAYSEPTAKNQQLVIVYWPQYVQFIGLGLLFISLGGFTYWFIKRR